MAIEYTPESSLVADPAEGGSFSASNNAELAGAQSFAAQAKLSEIAAATSETNSANSATASAGSATAASGSVTQSADSATASANSATNSATSETNALAYKVSAEAASVSAVAAKVSAEAARDTAAGSATTATTQAGIATTQAGTATTDAGTATTQAGIATTQAGIATAQAGIAIDKADIATTQAGTATTKAGEANTSKVDAEAAKVSAESARDTANASATTATNSANSATNSATSATNSATSATNSATSAGTAQTAAEAARDAALAAFDSFDDRYLGPKASDPTTDNDGDALAAGMLYFNTSTDDMKVYEGSSWVNAYASLSGALIATNNLSDLNNAATARTNLGLGTAATTAATDYATAAQGTKVDGIEAGADVTDTANVTAAGALMDSELTSEASVKALNQGVATTDSPTFAGLTVDTDTLYVDSTNNTVGIGTNNPDYSLTIVADDPDIRQEMPSSSSANLIQHFFTVDGVQEGQVVYNKASGSEYFGLRTTKDITFQTGGSAERMRIASTGGSTFTSDDGIAVHTATNGGGADITFSDNATDGTYAQNGTIKYVHTNTDSYGSGCAFRFESTETSTSIVGNNAVFDNYLVKPATGTGAGSLVIDASRNITANHIKADRIYSNDDGSTGYFYNDSGTRTAYTGGDFYIQSGVGNCYLYATNTYLGGTSGDTILLRGNAMTHNGWSAQADGHIRMNDSQHMRFGNGGDVELFFSGTHFYMDLNSGGNNFYIRDGSTTRFTFDDAGHFTATGNVTAYSDRRLKDDIQPIEGALEKVGTLSGNTYQRNDLLDKDPERRYAGVIAQEVEAVLPEAVSESEDGTKTVDYNAVIALLVESIKELKAEVAQLKGGV